MASKFLQRISCRENQQCGSTINGHVTDRAKDRQTTQKSFNSNTLSLSSQGEEEEDDDDARKLSISLLISATSESMLQNNI